MSLNKFFGMPCAYAKPNDLRVAGLHKIDSVGILRIFLAIFGSNARFRYG